MDWQLHTISQRIMELGTSQLLSVLTLVLAT